jgi:hypothetical protein
MRRARSGWWALGEWSLAVGIVAIAVLSLPSLGLFLLPVALAACALAAIRNRAWPEGASGVLVGTGVAGLLVGFLNLGYVPCSSGPMELAPGESSYSCGGFDPRPWLVAGVLLLGGGLVAYFLLSRGEGSRTAPARDAA